MIVKRQVVMFCWIRLDDEDVGPFGNDPIEGDWTDFPEREPLAHLSKDKMEEDLEGEEVEEEEGEGDGEEEYREEEDGEEENRKEKGGEGDGGGFKSSADNFMPFIIPKIWFVNNFLPKMSLKVFNKLHDCFQIPIHIPLRFPGKKEK